MGFSYQENANDLFIYLEGDISITEAAEIFQTIKDNLDLSITFDMAKLESMDTAITQLIIASIIKFKDNKLNIISPPEAVMKSLERVGLSKRLQVTPEAFEPSRAIGEA